MLVPTLGLSLMLVSAASFSGRPDDEDLDYAVLAQRFADRYEIDFGEGAGHEALGGRRGGGGRQELEAGTALDAQGHWGPKTTLTGRPLRP